MSTDQLDDRLRSTTEPTRPLDVAATVAAGNRARRIRSVTRSAIGGSAVVAIVAAVGIALTAELRVPDIESPPVAAGGDRQVEDASARRAPTPEQVDGELDFVIHSVEPPPGWTLDAVTLTPEGSFADAMGVLWLETRWTPGGGQRGDDDLNGEGRVPLVLRQTHMSTLDDDLSIVIEGLAAVEFGDDVAFISRGVIIWKQGDTYLELRGPSTPEGLLRDIAATTEASLR